MRAQFNLCDHVPALRKRFKTGRCEMTGLPFDMAAIGKRKWNSPSVDRKDAKLGYTIENVRFILWGLNASLSDWGEQVLERMITAWLANRAQTLCEDCE